jgi:acylphosphatase
MECYYLVHGRVQGVMFRQTVVRAAMARGLVVGATNTPNPSVVELLLRGEAASIDEMESLLTAGRDLNSWGARVERLERQTGAKPLEQYEVTSDNVNTFDWNPNLERYI